MKSFTTTIAATIFLAIGYLSSNTAFAQPESTRKLAVGDQIVFDIYWPQFLGRITVWVGTRTDTVTAIEADGSLTMATEAHAHFLTAIDRDEMTTFVYTPADLDYGKILLQNCVARGGVVENVTLLNHKTYKTCKISLPHTNTSSGAEWYSDDYQLGLVKFEYNSSTSPNLVGYFREIRKISK